MRLACLLLGMTCCLWTSALCAEEGQTKKPKKPADVGQIRLDWEANFLTIRAPRLPGDELKVHYLEAYCRPGSTDREWGQTVVGHKTELLSRGEDGRRLELRCQLSDGVVVEHVIRAGAGEVTFDLTASNPTDKASEAHWAQPCVRVDRFTGKGSEEYIKQCFILLDGKLARLPTEPWAVTARYTPGQVYCPQGVDRDDVNPRPLSALVPSGGMCGCYSGDGRWIMATAWEPYQELFQGVATCMHTDFRLAGLAAGETRQIRGKIYLAPADEDALLERFLADFPEQAAP